jgi:hypothetical protein
MKRPSTNDPSRKVPGLISEDLGKFAKTFIHINQGVKVVVSFSSTIIFTIDSKAHTPFFLNKCNTLADTLGRQQGMFTF